MPKRLHVIHVKSSSSEVEDEILTEEEMQLDAMFRQAFAERQIRYNKMQTVKPLQDLCVNKVVNNLNYFCNKQELFSCLPGPILTLLKKSVNTYYKFASPEVVFCFITEQSKNLDLQLYGHSNNKPVTEWTRDLVDLVFDLLSHKCENKLTHLCLQLNPCLISKVDRYWFAPQPSLDQLNQVMRHQINLIELDLKNCGIKDETLAVIGSTCEQLELLDLYGNKDVTDEGILYLCGDSKIYGRCLKLKNLKLGDTSVKHLGILNAISKLPDLEDVCISPQKILLDVLLQYFYMFKGTKKLQLKYLLFDDKDSSPFVKENMSNIFQMLPNLNGVDIESNDLTPLYSLPNITTLTLYECTSHPFDIQIKNLLANLGSKLTELKINSRNETEVEISIDISMLGYFCPNIKNLELDSCYLTETSAYPLLGSFQKLVNFDIFSVDVIPIPVSTQILSSEFLEKVTLYGVPEETILSLISKAKIQDCGIFSNLKCMFLTTVNEYSVDTWLQLFCVALKLKQICMFDNTLYDSISKVQNFIKRNNLNIRFGD